MVLFLYFPLMIIVLYAFDPVVVVHVPPPGLTLEWFRVAFTRADMWQAFGCRCWSRRSPPRGRSCSAACSREPCTGAGSSAVRPWRSSSCCRSRPGIVTGIALKSTLSGGEIFDLPPGFWTIVIGHTTFCTYRLQQRGGAPSPPVAEHRGGVRRPQASGWQTFRHVMLPNLATALLAGGVLAFAALLRRDHRDDVHAWKRPDAADLDLPQLFRPRNRPVTNVVAIIAVTVTIVPVLLAQMLARSSDDAGTGMGAGGATGQAREPIPAA